MFILRKWVGILGFDKNCIPRCCVLWPWWLTIMDCLPTMMIKVKLMKREEQTNRDCNVHTICMNAMNGVTFETKSIGCSSRLCCLCDHEVFYIIPIIVQKSIDVEIPA